MPRRMAAPVLATNCCPVSQPRRSKGVRRSASALVSAMAASAAMVAGSRFLGIEVLVCPKCSGVRRVLAAIHDPVSIARVLGAMGLPLAVSEQAGCRAPPAGEGVDDVGEGTAE